MHLKIVAVAKLKEKHWKEAAADYIRRIGPYARLEILEIAEARLPEKGSGAEEKKAMAQEGRAILERLVAHDGPVIALDRKGKAFDSPELAAWLEGQLLKGRNDMAFVIGGPVGLAPEVLARSDLVLSFSRMTFPHQLMRVILLEQLYRSLRIMRREPYHK
ncbi:Ribosomal RNA large subunit methyltransferase H [uncultured archaeon]|nr:Ribosomal RNA large subunit methyltransferase H [uncultured archaeon]